MGLRINREAERVHRESRHARMEVLAHGAHPPQLRPPDAQHPHERHERAKSRYSVLEPSEGYPHHDGDEGGCEGCDGEGEEGGSEPDAEAGDEPVDELVLRDFVPCVPDGACAFELVHGDEGRDEDGEPEDEPWGAEREEGGGPGEADGDSPEDRAACEGPSDPVVFDAPACEPVLVYLQVFT